MNNARHSCLHSTHWQTMLLASFMAGTLVADAVTAATYVKPRIIVTTDITNEPDDQQSLVRLLAYSNNYDIEGLIGSTGIWKLCDPAPEVIHKCIDAYSQVRSDLVQHDRDFPTAEYLHRITKTGNRCYPTYRLITSDRAMQPTRPVIDLAPCYENHPYHADGSSYWANPKKWDGKTRGTAALIREQAYWGLLAGAAGHTYAGDDVWQFHESGPAAGGPAYRPNTPWRQAMDFPGAQQMGIMRRLFESRPWHTMDPDQSIVVTGQSPGENHIQAARASDGKFLFVYLPRGNELTIDMTKIQGAQATAYWFNPRSGEATIIGSCPCAGTRDFQAPSQVVDHDWVLVLDEAAQRFSIPGKSGPT